jgi:hypothetical protein
VSEQELDGSQVTSAPIDQHGLSATKRVRAETSPDRVRCLLPIPARAGRIDVSLIRLCRHGRRRGIDRASAPSV